MIRILALGMLVLAAACSRDGEAAAPPPAPHTAPVEAAPPAAKPVKLLAGETLATELAWPVAGGTVTLAAVIRGEKVVVRAFTTTSGLDITRPVYSGLERNELRLVDGGAAVVFEARTLLGRVAELGAVFSYDLARIEWDAAAGTPVVRETWSCDEEEEEGYCELPAWAE
jgi:hypothetical protein